MAADYKPKFKEFLPGAGFDSSGGPKQGKRRVVGLVDVTSYTRGGEPLAPVDIGLTVIDSITLRVSNQTGDTSGGNKREALYNQVDDVFYLVNVDQAGASGEYAAAATETVEYTASGDSADDVELT